MDCKKYDNLTLPQVQLLIEVYKDVLKNHYCDFEGLNALDVNKVLITNDLYSYFFTKPRTVEGLLRHLSYRGLVKKTCDKYGLENDIGEYQLTNHGLRKCQELFDDLIFFNGEK